MNRYNQAHPHYLKDRDGCGGIETPPNSGKQAQTEHNTLCDMAAKHYEEVSGEVCHWNSLIPKAIEFYKKYGDKQIAIIRPRARAVMTGIRPY